MYEDPFSFTTKNLAKGAIGFDEILRKLHETANHLPKIPVYPPYNIKKIDNEHYVIEMAVAGFGKQNLDIELKENELTITGKTETEDSEYLYKGIANRAFERNFTIADSVVVKNAELVNGMLKIFLERFIPEDKKPKKIDILDPFGIGEATKQFLTEATWRSNQDSKDKDKTK